MQSGVLDSECRLLRSDIARMDRAIFRIIIPYQYSAAKELKEYLAGEREKRDDTLCDLIRGQLN